MSIIKIKNGTFMNIFRRRNAVLLKIMCNFAFGKLVRRTH